MNPIQGVVDQLKDIRVLSDFSEEELLRNFMSYGNRQALFMELVGRYKVRVYSLVRRILIDHDDANDAAQNTFIKVWENMDGFRGDCAVFSWIYRITTNEALTLIRKKRPNLSFDDANYELANIIDSGNHIDGTEEELKLQKAITILPEKQRLVFNLKYFENLTYEQISEITGTSVGALKASYFHAVKKNWAKNNGLN